GAWSAWPTSRRRAGYSSSSRCPPPGPRRSRRRRSSRRVRIREGATARWISGRARNGAERRSRRRPTRERNDAEAPALSHQAPPALRATQHHRHGDAAEHDRVPRAVVRAQVVTAESAFAVPLVDQATRTVLDRDLVGTLDLVEREADGHLVAVDLKTA